MLNFHSIETFGTHEGPGIRLVVFLQGCNFRCLYCHNPDTHNMKAGTKISFKKIIELAKEQEAYFNQTGGVTVSGGEPLLQSKTLIKLFKSLHRHKIQTAIDTNGGVFDAQVKELLKYTDLVLLDIKHIDPEQHKKVAGIGNEKVLAFANYLKKINKPFWIRYVLVPGLTDQPEFLRKLGEYFKDFTNLERLEILPYHNLGVYKYHELGKNYVLSHVDMPTPEQIEKARKEFKRYFKNVFVR